MRDLKARLEKSDLFFMAGAITFNILVAMVPLLILVVGIAGYVVSARYADPVTELLQALMAYLPAVEGEIELIRTVGGFVEEVVRERTGLSLVGAGLLLWISTRLVASLRVVLRNIFSPEHDRGIIQGKLFDFQVVLLGGLLLILNMGATVVLQTAQRAGVIFLGMAGGAAELTQFLAGQFLAFVTAWLLFYLIYRFVPPRRIKRRVAAVGATFTALFHELMKAGFAWYVTSLADFTNAYGSLAVFAILFFWIYYSSVVFIVGGVVARSYEVRREVRMKRRGEGSTGGAVSALLIILALTLPGSLGAQVLAPFGGNGNGNGNGNGGLLNPGESVVFADRSLEREMVIDAPLVEHDGAYVVVHIAESRVFVMEGREVLWSSPAGTGHGFQLEGQGQQWTFTTPVGMFQVLRKEKDPVWIVPDWWYVQRDIPIPPRNDPSRYISGTLGTSALFLGDGIAIHGTDQPQLLMNGDPEARRVSHGCIRLTDEAARQLYHLVDVGTPVLIY